MARARPAALLILVLGVAGAVLLSRAQPACGRAAWSDGVRLTVAGRADNALIVDTTVELDQPAPVFLEYGNDRVGWLRTPTSAVDERHRLPIVRLQPGTGYQVRAFALDAAGCPAAASAADFATGELPKPLAQTVVKAVGEASFPVLLMDHRSLQPVDEPAVGWLVAVDRDGRLVWYYELPDSIPVPPNTRASVAVKPRANGNLIYQASLYGLDEITPDGRIVRHIPVASDPAAPLNHHDFVELPDGRLLFFGKEDRPVPRPGGGAVRPFRGDTLHLLNVASGALEQVWSSWDVMDPNVRPDHWREKDDQSEDWTHANAIHVGARGNVLISMRNVDQVISLAPDLKSVEWRLGGRDSTFSFPDPGDRFYGQHTAFELEPGRILLFDNGNFRPAGEWSRGLELRLDFETMTARKIWEYRQQPDFFAPRGSGVERLANGNTVLNFGQNVNVRNGFTAADYGLDGPEWAEPILAVEARPDGSAAWQLWMDRKSRRSGRYRVYPLDSLAGEVSVTPTETAGGPSR